MGFTVFLLWNGTEVSLRLYTLKDISVRYSSFHDVSINAQTASLENVNIRHAMTEFTVRGE
jgi:hypothetical protein